MNTQTIPKDWLTRRQAAQVMGVTVQTLGLHCRNGRLCRCDSGGERKPAYYRQEDVLACYSTYTMRGRRASDLQIDPSTGELNRRCKKCQKWVPVRLYSKQREGLAGTNPNCPDCRRVGRTAPRTKVPYGESQRRAGREFYRRQQAILCGKSSPVLRDGFRLLRSSEGEWQAWRLSLPLPLGTVAWVEYHRYSSGKSGFWEVTACNNTDRSLSLRMQSLARRLNEKEQEKSA